MDLSSLLELCDSFWKAKTEMEETIGRSHHVNWVWAIRSYPRPRGRPLGIQYPLFVGYHVDPLLKRRCSSRKAWCIWSGGCLETHIVTCFFFCSYGLGHKSNGHMVITRLFVNHLLKTTGCIRPNTAPGQHKQTIREKPSNNGFRTKQKETWPYGFPGTLEKGLGYLEVTGVAFSWFLKRIWKYPLLHIFFELLLFE